MKRRVFLDWNATTPLRAEARAAMVDAMDVFGNASSVHQEGRKAKALLEKARGRLRHVKLPGPAGNFRHLVQDTFKVPAGQLIRVRSKVDV